MEPDDLDPDPDDFDEPAEDDSEPEPELLDSVLLALESFDSELSDSDFLPAPFDEDLAADLLSVR